MNIVTASRDQLAEAMVIDCIMARQLNHEIPARLIFDANGHALSLRASDPGFRKVVDQADIIHADGGFLVSASKRVCSQPIAERSATTDMIHDFAAKAAEAGLSFYLLGGSEEVNARCAEILQARYPSLQIVGRRHGYFTADEEPAVVDEINMLRPDILWVGLGKPKEQQFAANYRDAFRAGWVVTCGGCFNYITGHYKRAPMWMQRANLEWLHRMVTNPRQLFLAIHGNHSSCSLAYPGSE
jgi:N-acetylglucosaminyldiphosphoundecaprenol N-acetyl-beta-D-mannosaminyltransferase